MAGVYAEELLRDRGHKLTPQGVYDAVLASTGDPLKAELEASKRHLQLERERLTGGGG